MTTAQYPNRDALQQGLNIYRDEMSSFIARCLRQKQGSTLVAAISRSLTDRQAQDFEDSLQENDGKVETAIEIGFVPRLVEQNWTETFQRQFRGSRSIRNTLRGIRDLRNELAHERTGEDIAADKAETGLYHVSEALASINRPEQQKAVLAIRDRIRQGQEPSSTPQPELIPTPPSLGGNGHALKPWREVMTPSPDVEDGSFEEAEFAANLQQVYDGSAAAVYGDPREFFRRTYVTAGIRNLLVNAARRVNGNGGNPVIQTKTGFGGGKTHSLIALYHLIANCDELLNVPAPQYSRIREEIRSIITEAGADPDSGISAQIAVLSGTWLSPNSDRTTDAGDPLNTLWGEMAWQLGGQDAYETVGASARSGNAPGGEDLDKLFQQAGPCVILMDEIVNYARNTNLNLDGIATFFQNLTEAVQRRSDVVLVVSLPVTATEAGGPRGMEVLQALENLLNRLQSVMQVTETSNDEAFAVVRRRLFQDECDETAREATCQAFYRMYQRGANDYPANARETRYQERLRQCYPIHPEIFDRLYQDWSLYHEFQRTRGVLRLMAQTISRLCADGEASPMIMPGNLPFNDAEVSNEFVRLLGPQWDAVLAEVDQENSRTHAIDRQQPARFGGVGGAARRIARAVFLGSSAQKTVRGIDARQVNLAVAMPTHGVAVYGEAILAMDGQLYHFYRGDDNRYYFDAQENLNKVANDRAAELTNEAVNAEIVRRLNEFTSLSENRAVVVCPQSPSDVPDRDFTRLIILGPDQTRPSRAGETDHASDAATTLLQNSGDDARRTRPNTLLFLAAANDRIRDLRPILRRFLAWDSIVNGDRRLSLSGERRSQAQSQQSAHSQSVQSALENAYRWIMAPTQPDPARAEYDATGWRQIPGDADLAANALSRFVQDEQLVDRLTPVALNQRLQEYLWNGPNPRYHVTVDELWNLLTANVYMRLRLRNRPVLEQCLSEGIAAGVFGRADGHDAASGKYRNLTRRVAEAPASYATTPLSGSTLIVEPEMAELYRLESDGGLEGASSRPDQGGGTLPPEPEAPDRTEPAPGPRLPRQIVARKRIAADVVTYDFNQLRDEIIRNLRNDGGDVTVEVIIRADKTDGFSESITRAVRENSVQLELDFTESDYAPEP
jgi:hypothetical protein